MNDSVHQDPVGLAIKNCDKPLVLGRIERIEDLFEEVSYLSVGKSMPAYPWPDNKEFPLFNEDPRSSDHTPDWKWRLHAVPAKALMDKLIDIHGRCRLRDGSARSIDGPFHYDISAIGGFKIIPWSKQGVALVKACRSDFSEFATWIGFIDLKNLPAYQPNVSVEAAKINPHVPRM